jgi:hypothetical protein
MSNKPIIYDRFEYFRESVWNYMYMADSDPEKIDQIDYLLDKILEIAKTLGDD